MTLKSSCRICDKVKKKNYKILEEVLGKYLPQLIQEITGIEINTLEHGNILVCEECAICIIHTNIVRENLCEVFRKKRRSAGNDVLTKKRKADVEEEVECNQRKKIRLSVYGVGSSIIEDSNVVSLSCGVCDFQTVKPKILQNHLTKHNINTLKLYKCSNCQESYQRPRNLIKHFNMVHKDEMQESSCSGVNGHSTINMERDTVENCDTNKSDSTKSLINFSSNKKDIRGFECDICNYCTDAVTAFKSHLSKVHYIKKPKVFACKLCPLSYRNQTILKEHAMEVHHQTFIQFSKRRSARGDASKNQDRASDSEEINTDLQLSDNNNDDIGDDDDIDDDDDENNTDFTKPNNSSDAEFMLMESENDNVGVEKLFAEIVANDMKNDSAAKNVRSNEEIVDKIKSPMKPSLETESMSNILNNGYSVDKTNNFCLDDTNNFSLDDSINFSLDDIQLNTQLDQSGILKCDSCSYQTFKEKEYRMHLFKEHNIKNANHFECSQCSESFETKDSLKNHILDEHDSQSSTVTAIKTLNEKKFKCSQCSESFETKLSLSNHLLENHGSQSSTATPNKTLNEKKFKCSQCPESFEKKSKLKNHILDEHNSQSSTATPTKTLNEKKFKCSQCSESFETKGSLNNHILDEHASLSSIATSIKSKPRNDSIGSEKSSTNTSDNIPSAKKSKSFKKIRISPSKSAPLTNNDETSDGKNNSQTINVTKDDEKPSVADKPQKVCTENKDLERKKTHTEEKRKKDFVKLNSTQNEDGNPEESIDYCCAICEKEFSAFSKLRRHMDKLHPNMERYACKYCPKATKSQEKYLIHIKRCRQGTHHCPDEQCNKKFHNLKELHQHISLHHISNSNLLEDIFD